MAFTLFDLHLGGLEKAGVISFGVSSNGTTITLNDRTGSSAAADDQLNNGSIYFIESTNVSIQGQFRRITDYDASSGQFTFSSLSSAVTTATAYGVATPEFNLTLLNRLSNASIRALGPAVFTDRSLVTSAAQKVYTLSTNIKYGSAYSVSVAGRIGSTTTLPEWNTVSAWEIQPSTAGAANLLIFRDQPPAGRDVRILYEGQHPTLTNSTDLID